MEEKWWQKSVVYQIYPKSFNDTTGNGMGDINGITEKLDYLKELGVDVIWLTPIYLSPQKDNGYDIADYYAIQPEFGTMEDFETMMEKAHRLGLKIIMDIVVNHTSTSHKWFQESRKSKDNPYRNYYIWKDGKPGELPTNWESKFGGNTWEYDEATGSYYLHLFDVTQADLNWENEKVRDDVYQMMNFWLDKGVDGFRLDVINLISKDQRFPNDDGSVPPGDGRKFYTDGPRVHEFLHEMNQEVFKGRKTLTVGEMSSTSMEDCIKYTNPEREELDMTFNFHHLKVDYPNGDKWTKAPFDFLYLKQLLSDWQTGMQEGGGWNALFWCNHDQPRIVSRFGDDTTYHKESAKMLATTMHMMQGTPYIYQGEEIGMTNPGFEDISQYRDVESLNMYKIKKAEGLSNQEIIEILQQKSRDNSRTPMQWNHSANAGFTEGIPWIGLPDNYQEINAEAAVADKTSIFYHYQKLIQLRKDYQVITDGKYELILPKDFAIFAYIRENEDIKLLVVNNFYANEAELDLPESIHRAFTDSEIILSNYTDSPSLTSDQISLRPYESVVYYLKK
ncbi:trehalose-6-phosphate hydrolase [Oceanobacillus oncorhynchi subsp. incaldanensis]|uniref:Alpha,alpha-phosphotrehalase n=1 Tax=Oceanobacillus oncorhynchi TaxID=545501 RepID=A0A0A1MQJ8_9BACI|nr:alpha,alpha-phosphotrehalase [Oceanobacillus oncorhynchi]GIO18581.1 trehalose-6-phosphate hydrolase [Oceanobacillus oncorhynchi subsp. incaldanensis]CEI81907.1 Trehalose-6-phosphate hydrolase [Oceanobacillus oncorhynchi]